MRIWLIGLVVLILVWGAGLLAPHLGIGVPWGALVGLSVLDFAGVAALFAWRRYSARAAARALERELLKQSEQPASPERQAELVELKVQFEKGIQALKASRLAESGGNVLYALPWYVMVGPPGAGKTTALRHSGLNFPFLDPREGGGLKGVGGTRNCDWWFTNEAILLDTAGRYTTSDDDRREWFAFLDALRRYRRKKPINGVILTVSSNELLDGTSESNAALAHTLRARIDELQSRLDMIIPVYVMFTKADLIAGFVEFFADLKKSERNQVFGATFEQDEIESTAPGTLFQREFKRLESSLQARVVKRLPEEHDDESRKRIVQFPLEFAALERVLPDFLNALFGDTHNRERPVFRGFYFTSGTQEGNAVERVLGGIARAFGIAVPPPTAAPLEPKSYFVTELFRRVVFPDQDIAGRTRRERIRQLVLEAAIGAVGLLLAVAVFVFPTYSFRQNMKLVDSARLSAKNAARVDWSGSAPIPQKVVGLVTLREQLKQLDTWRESAPPLSLRWGMYIGETIYPGLRETYTRGIERGLVPLHSRLEEWLRTAQLENADGEAYQTTYDRLKLYLVMGTPQVLSGNPPLVDMDWAKKELARDWARALGSRSDGADEAALLPHAEHYLELLRRGEAKPWTLDETVIRRARTELLRKPQLDRMYEALIHEADAEIAPIRQSDIFTGSAQPFFKPKQDLTVSGAYTKAGWERVKKLLGSQRARLVGEGWVLGEDKERSRELVERDIKTLRLRYFETYKQSWHDFFRDIDVHEPENGETALAELSAISEPEWVYRRLSKLLWENATLDVSEEGADAMAKSLFEKGKQVVAEKFGAGDKSKAPEQKPVSAVEEAFRPIGEFGVPPPRQGDKPAESTGLDTWQAAIAKLIALLTDIHDGDTDADPQKVVSEFETAYRTTGELLATQTGYTRPMLSPLLLRPIAYAWAGVVKDAGGAAGGLWETTVWTMWRHKLEDRYPFKMSADDTNIEDFTEFFKPKEGLLWGFYDANLKGSLRRVGHSYEPTRRFQTSSRYTPNFVEKCLSRGDEITAAVFGADGKPTVKFRVNLHSVSPRVSQVSLEIDGSARSYRNHPEEWLEAEWPAEKPEARGARLRILGENGLDEQIIRQGAFGFYRLIDSASTLEPGRAGGDPNGAPTVVATWKLRTEDAFIKLDILPSKEDRALLPAIFKGYTCPRVITR